MRYKITSRVDNDSPAGEIVLDSPNYHTCRSASLINLAWQVTTLIGAGWLPAGGGQTRNGPVVEQAMYKPSLAGPV